MALRRRVAAGELVHPYPALYARASYWQQLNPSDRTLHMARALSILHKDWVFAGMVAAAAHGFEHQWSLHDGTMTVVTHHRGSYQRSARLRHVYVPKTAQGHVNMGGIPVTGEARTLVDCGLSLEFRFALPIFDSALAKGVTVDSVLRVCGTLNVDCRNVFRLLHYADAGSENGGESLARGTMIDSALQVPRLQVGFIDPKTGRSYRADFVWDLPDGRIIVGEFDGQGKYVDPSMTGGTDIAGVVSAERERQEGLQRAGVCRIFRFNFREVMNRRPLLDKALAAGVPLRAGGGMLTQT